MRLRWAASAALCATLLLAGCGGTTLNPTPAISALYPETIAATLVGPPACTSNPSPLTINVAGNNFMTTSVAYWNGAKRATTFNQNTGQLAVTLLACDLATPGIAYVSVTNPAPGGGPSEAAAPFQITQPQNPVPSISSFSPASVAASTTTPPPLVTINGASFISSSQVAVNGQARASTLVSSSALQTQLLSSDIASAGTLTITVTNPTPGGGTATAVFSVTDPPNAANFPQVISVSATGGAANGASSSPAMTADGRYVAFYSEATNLVATGASGNIFVRDTCVGATNCTPHTIAVDLAPDGSAPNAPAASSVRNNTAISADGRFVTFTSWASNLAAGSSNVDPHIQQVFVRDLCAGSSAPAKCTTHTELVSVGPDGSAIQGSYPALSADGRFVAFSASGQILVRDTCNGSAAVACTPGTVTASSTADSQITVALNAKPAISGNGRYVVFEGTSSQEASSNGRAVAQIFAHDTCVGASAVNCQPSTLPISVSAGGDLGNADSVSPAVSADGRFVVFQSGASNLDSGAEGRQDIFLRDTCAGTNTPTSCSPSTRRISVDASGISQISHSSGNYSPAISASGRYISFTQQRANDEPGFDARGLGYLVVYDTCFGASDPCSPQMVAPQAVSNSSLLNAQISMQVPISLDGDFAAFFSDGAVAANPKSGLGDVFLTLTPSIQH
jgi:hypothetical protein